MPVNAFTNPDNFAITGSMTIVADPRGNTGSSGNLDIEGALEYGAVTGGIPSATTLSQSLSTSGVAITMTSGVVAGGPHVLYVSAASTTATCVLTPTSSASTSGLYQNGLEITLVNLAASGSNILIPTSSAGVQHQAALTISAGRACKFIYVAALQTWVPQAL